MKFDCNYPHASTVKRIDQLPNIPSSDNRQGFVPPLVVQTIIALHCIISSLRPGLLVRSSQDWVISLFHPLYHRDNYSLTSSHLHTVSFVQIFNLFYLKHVNRACLKYYSTCGSLHINFNLLKLKTMNNFKMLIYCMWLQ